MASATKKTAAERTSSNRNYSSGGFTDEEKSAMKERAKEVKSAAKGKNADQEEELLAKIAEMPDADREMAERIHRVVKEAAPALTSRTWYGMPAYAKDGKVLCFFQSAGKFKSRYATFGFSDEANLDDGGMWPASYALTRVTAAEEKQIAALVKQAVS